MADGIEQVTRWLGAGRARPPHGLEAYAARVIAEPRGADEVAELVRRCEIERMTLAPIGSCRTLRYLRPAPVEIGVSLAPMAEVVAYEPDDMTVTVQPGITLAALQAHLDSRAQHLPVDPPEPERTTLGALLGAAQAGPLRLSAGTARDLLIGIQFVGHGGEIVRAGGRVVKNVAGYDLMKLMIGSFGTLGVITEGTFKVRPRPSLYAMVAVAGAELEALCDAGFALHDALPLLHLELLGTGVDFPLPAGAGGLLIVGVGGNRPDLDYQLGVIRERVPGATIHEGEDAAVLYRALVNLKLPPAPVTMQLSVLPRSLPSCLANSPAHFRAHLAAGVAQIAIAADDARAAVASAVALRQAAGRAHGHARVIAIDDGLREAIAFFDSPPAGAMALMRRVKAAFDPAGIFNPGGFAGGL